VFFVGISDVIARFLQESLDEADGGVLELQRSELAQRFNCVPSQINYVMSTRFSPEHGYIVESRRGGNGYIRITRVRLDRQGLIMHVVNSVGDRLDYPSAKAIAGNLVSSGAVDAGVGETLLLCMEDKSLSAAPREVRDRLRADLMKQVLIHQLG
jgi:transcriptional regulator CtsR